MDESRQNIIASLERSIERQRKRITLYEHHIIDYPQGKRVWKSVIAECEDKIRHYQNDIVKLQNAPEG